MYSVKDRYYWVQVRKVREQGERLRQNPINSESDLLTDETWFSRYESWRETEREQFRQDAFVPNSVKGLQDIERDQVCFSLFIVCARPGAEDDNQ